MSRKKSTHSGEAPSVSQRQLRVGELVRHAVAGATKTKRKKPFPAGLDLKAIDLSVAVASKILRRDISPADNERLIDDTVREMQTKPGH